MILYILYAFLPFLLCTKKFISCYIYINYVAEIKYRIIEFSKLEGNKDVESVRYERYERYFWRVFSRRIASLKAYAFIMIIAS